MLQKIVEKIINKVIGQYVEEFNSDNLHIGIWQGHVIIRDVRLKKDIIKKLNLPFNIKFSKLGCLKMNIPWSSLGSSKIQVSVEGLELLITEVPQQFWVLKNHKIIQHRKKQIQNYCDTIINDFVKKSLQSNKNNTENEQGYFNSMIMKIIDNIQVTVKDIHIRFEDQIGKMFSFGVTLEQLKIYTVNKHGQPEFIDRTKKNYENQPLRKKLLMSNLGVYWNQRSQFFKNADPHQEMLDSIYRQNGANTKKMNYLIMMTFNAMLYQRQPGKQFNEPQINLLIDFNQLKIEISNQQLQQIVTLAQRFQRFTLQLKAQNRKKLTQLQMIANRQIFLTLFPKYFQSKCNPEQTKKIDQILQKMQTVNFQEGIKQYLQNKQKQKLIQQKMQKNKGWFTGPKDLTEQQIEQIQKFVRQNFGVQTKVVKRPQNYYYIKVNFNLKLLEIIIAINSLNKDAKQGIRVKFNEIKMQFNLREQGYMLNFGMSNIKIDIFKQFLNKNIAQQTINIVQTISSQQKMGISKQYVKLQVLGNPLQKKYLDTQLILQTEQLLIQFHPKLIRIALDFAKIKLSNQNSEAAFEAYGQLKNKAVNVANESIKKPFKKKNFISIDVKISSINLILLFDPEKPNNDIWAIRIGQTRIYSDPQIVKKTQFTYDEPMQKYGLSFSKISFLHFINKNAFFYSRSNNFEIDRKSKIISDLQIDFYIQLFKSSTQQIPKVRGKTVVGSVDLYLSSFTYESIQKIGDCFSIITIPSNQKPQIQQKQKMQLKSQIMKQAKKIGIIYEQSKDVKKYIAVLNGNYLYLYNDKKDLDYSECYFLKNCKITYNNQTDPSKKVFEVTLSNSINTIKLGFDRQQNMQQWITTIKNVNAADQQYKSFIQERKKDNQAQSPTKRKKLQVFKPDQLNLQICAIIQNIKVNTLLQNNKYIAVSVSQFNSKIKIHQAKNVIDISLHSVQISDNIYSYKYKQLTNFIYSSAIAGKQKLIEISVVNLSLQHPQYKLVDVGINVEFGKLICNYKPETMERVMNFYIPKDSQLMKKRKQKGGQLTNQQKLSLDKQKKKRKAELIQQQLNNNKPQCFIIELQIKVQQISACLVNRKNRVMFSKLGLTGFDFKFKMSLRRMVMEGSLQQIWFGDYSNYPYTIYEEQQDYKQVYYIVQSYGKNRSMINFNVQLLEMPNSQGKTILVGTQVYDIKASYIQQPVLRCISYLLKQVLPSLTPPQDLSQPKQQPKNDTKPEISNIKLIVKIQNVLAIVQPRCGDGEYLLLHVAKIDVRNSSFYRQFIKNRKQEEENVLIQNYRIKMQGIKIVQKFNNRSLKLTNDLNFDVSCDLIQNSPYYRQKFGERFDAGMRVNCQLTPFLMCINHDDYNFIMKCLFWNIIYDDNAEGYFSNAGQHQIRSSLRQSKIHVIPSDPIHVGISMSKIILCVTQNNFPLSVLLLNQMRYDLTLDEQGMYMVFKMKYIYGTTISKTNDPQVSIQRGMFNSFGYEKKHSTKQLYKMQNLVNAFQRTQLTYKDTNQYVVYFKMITKKIQGQSIISLKVKNIGIAIELKTLLILSKLALMEESIQPPKSTIKPIHEKPIIQNNGMTINIEINNFLGCLGDKNFTNYIVMEGLFYIKLKLSPSATEQEIILHSKSAQTSGRFRDQSSYQVQIKNYSLYFCNVYDLKNKRYILMPLNIFAMLKQFYGKIHDRPYLQTEIDGMMDKVIIQCSVRDMLMINKIIQQNLQTLSQVNQNQSPPLKNESSVSAEEMNFKQDVQLAVDINALRRTIKQPQKKIKNKTKGSIKLEPIQIKIVNDCDYNFMPVLNFVIQQSTLIYISDSMQSRFGHSIIIKLDFFNPRSASWQPILETFQISLDYTTKNTQFGPKSEIIISSSQLQQLKQLKINISTQLITTLLATIEIARQQKKQLTESESNAKQQDVQISPYIIQNKTNHTILIHRQLDNANKDIEVKPLFKGPLKMTQKGQFLIFNFKGKQYSISMQKFGTCIIPRVKQIHLEFRINKLNRIITFVNNYTIKNATNLTVFCVRYSEKKQKLQEFVEIAPQDSIPVKGQWFVQFSFNMKTFTPPSKIYSLCKLCELKAESEKFKFSITQKTTVLDHKVISLRAPFLISNCLPKNIKFQFISNGKNVSTKQIQAQSTHEVLANQDYFNLKFKIIAQGFYWCQEFYIDSTKLGKQQLLSLKDREDGSIYIKYIFEKDEKKCQFKLSLYCPAFILSELQEDVQIYGNRQNDERLKAIQKYYLLGGQSQFWKNTQGLVIKQINNDRTIDKVTLVGAQVGSKLRICGSNCMIDFSQPFSIKSLGVHEARVVVERNIFGRKVSVFTMLALQIQLKKMTKASNIFSKQITIRYRYIISNNTKHDIYIRENGSQKLCFNILRGEKKPFYFTSPSVGKQSQKMIIRTADSLQGLPIDSNVIGEHFFRLQHAKRKDQYNYFKINTQQIKSYIFYEFKQVRYEDLPYQIIVKSQKFKIFVPQFQKVLTKNNDPLLFINQRPDQGFNLFLLVSLIETDQSFELTVQTDDINFRKIISFTNPNTKKYIACLVQVIFSDNKRYIIFDDAKYLNKDNSQYEIQRINIKLQKLSISFIQNHSQVEKPYEALYFYMYNLQFIMVKTNLFTKYQTKLQFLQFDQNQPFNIPDPVIITPYKLKQFMQNTKKQKIKSIFNALVIIDNSFVKNVFINQIIIQINDIIVRASTYFIKLIMVMVKQYNDVFKTENQFLIQRKVSTWKTINIPIQGGSKTLIKSLKLAPFTVQLTAQLRLNQLDIESVLFFGTIINALGVVITNIQNAPIKFDGIVLANCVDTLPGIQQKLIQHYKGSVLSQLYKIFGSLNIIGNPVSLFRNISTGIKALKEKPTQGFLEGPLQFGLGIAGGTSSLLAHSIGGVLNSVEKVTGTFASGLAVLTFDKQFEEARQKQKMKKPKHIFEGLQKGGKAIFHGFKEGITGVFTKPIQHAKKQGALGFFKGTAQGMAGLVVKPVTGVIDMASKTTQGLKNTALYLQDKPNENRIRYPRVFYTECSVIRQYDPVDSKLYSIINKTKYEDRYGFENTMFMNSFMINQQQFLLVLKEDLVMIRIDTEKIEWAVPFQNLIVGRQDETKIRVSATARRQWYTKKVNDIIQFQNKQDIQVFLKLIEELKVNLKDKIYNKQLDHE